MKVMMSTDRKSTPGKGTTFTKVKQDDKEEKEEEEDCPLPSYEEYLCEHFWRTLGF